MNQETERLDLQLASLAREEAALRLRLGQALEVLGRGGVFELGFSSLSAYAVERCERSGRWAEGARCLARRLEALPSLRRALALGEVSWSMGEVLARVATREDEAVWLERARSRTVRQMREQVSRVLAAARRGSAARAALEIGSGSADEAGAGDGASWSEAAPEPGERAAGYEDDAPSALEAGDGVSDERCTLTCTVGQEEAWLYEATACLLEQLGARGCDERVEALLAEGQEALLAMVPGGTGELLEVWPSEVQQRRLARLARWRAEAEASCEGHIAVRSRASAEAGDGPWAKRGGVPVAASLGMTSLEALSSEGADRAVRSLARALARHELELSRAVLRFHRLDGWRRLGFATEAQYARERLGMSRSSVVGRRALALRLERLPAVAAALGAGHIGVEAALQLVRVATERTEAAWVARARRRTVKHLREEVAAAAMAVRFSGEVDCPPPEEAELEAVHELERAVVGGRVGSGAAKPGAGSNAGEKRAMSAACAGRAPFTGTEASELPPERRVWLTLLGSLAAWLDGGLQMSAARPSRVCSRAIAAAGRVRLRLSMSRATAAWWRGLEAQARPWLPKGLSWVRFLCQSVWRGWRHVFGQSVAYGHIYVRDRYRCTSPVCQRRDVTPHHLVFRSAGGGDDDANVVSLCTWCHLCGVHEGRIRAQGSAGHVHWEFGAQGAPCLVVNGRERAASYYAGPGVP